MKKTNSIKSVLGAIIAVGSLCACGSEPAGITSEVSPQTVTEEAPKPTVSAIEEQSPTVSLIEEQLSTGTGMTQTPDDGKLIAEEVESVIIRYYIGYNIATGDVISDSIPCYQIEVTGEDLETLATLIGGASKISADPYERIEYCLDDYELTVNDDIVLMIGDKRGLEAASAEVFEVPSELYEIVERIVQENNEKNVYQILGGDQISVTNPDGKVWDIEEEDQLEEIRSTQYYAINLSDDMMSGERVAYVVDTHNGDLLDVYFASVLGKLRYADGTYEYVHIGYLEDYLDDILR